MSISAYIRDIGRGKDGARALSREQAADLMTQVLEGWVSDLELGAFCLAMRIKGETPEEMAGFLDATHAHLSHLAPAVMPAVVLPSYNGAHKLPGLLPLLALLLARKPPRFIFVPCWMASKKFRPLLPFRWLISCNCTLKFHKLRPSNYPLNRP